MKVSDIQQAIFEQTRLKTSFKRMTGSMKHHVKIWPIFQGGNIQNSPLRGQMNLKDNFRLI